MAVLFSLAATAQTLNARYLDYIERYKAIAMEHSKTLGIPASITLAQGLLESRAGQSYLATRGNNHFGIKCHKWAGEAVEYDDSLKHDCYRKYATAEESFNDHAKFLKGKRYAPLYEHHVSKYRLWAHGLRRCGYAEDPAYPQKLIALIEQYELYKYDNALRDTTTVITTAPATKQAEAAAVTTAKTTSKPENSSKKPGSTPVPFPQSKIGKRVDTTVPERPAKVAEKPAVTTENAESPAKKAEATTKAKTQPATKAQTEPAKEKQEPAKKKQEPVKATRRQHNQRNTSTTTPLKGSADN